ncbi:MAG: 6-carboxytetrahydropterin synthase [Lachnospiraceae bacterium]|nr:6-carboxytetrahydropterin synthase [Lachnospiraceae bacterium]
MNRLYRWYFHFNASHNMSPEDLEKKHVHTFLVNACIEVTQMDIASQNECGDRLREYLARYRGAYLNELETFREKLPTIEGICEVLYQDMKEIAEQHQGRLLNLEVGDSPVAMFSMGEQLLLGFTYTPVRDEDYQMYLEQWNRAGEESKQT